MQSLLWTLTQTKFEEWKIFHRGNFVFLNFTFLHMLPVKSQDEID